MMRIGTLAGVVLLLALTCVPGAQAENGGGVSSLATETLTVSGSKGKDTAEAKFPILNSEDREVQVRVEFKASSDERVEVESWEPKTIPAGEAARLIVKLEGVGDLSEAVTGQLLIKGGKLPVAQSIKVDPPSPDEGWPAKIIFGSLIIALLALLGVFFRIREERSRLKNPAKPPKWEFDSWATNLTAIGAVFGAVLGEVTFPGVPSQVSKDELVNLNILFGGLVLIGPFLFVAIGSFPTAKTGTTRTMLFACTFTLWAVIGQMSCFGLLAWELLDGNLWAVVLAVATVVGIMLAWAYFFYTMSKQVVPGEEPEEDDEEAWSLL